MGQPLVSVLMPVYNPGAFLKEALESLLAQTYAAFEVIVIDDASSDGSAIVLAQYAARDPRVRVFRQPENRGIVAARNRAFAEARPDAVYYAILDSDDVALPDRLAQQVAFLEAHPDHALVGGHTLIIDDASTLIGIRRYPTDYAAICKVITRHNPFAQPAVMMRRSALAAEGATPYSSEFPRCQDYDLWLRLAARHPVANLDRAVIRYRISDTQGKRTALRKTLKLTLTLQRKWLFHRKYWQPYNMLYVAAEHGLLLLPESWVMALFKRVTYGNAPKVP